MFPTGLVPWLLQYWFPTFRSDVSYWLNALPTSILVGELLNLIFPTVLNALPTSILVGEPLDLVFPTHLVPCLLQI